jgi:hypothetical protein
MGSPSLPDGIDDESGGGYGVVKWGVIVVSCGLLFVAADRWPLIGLLIANADCVGVFLLAFGVVVLAALGALRI